MESRYCETGEMLKKLVGKPAYVFNELPLSDATKDSTSPISFCYLIEFLLHRMHSTVSKCMFDT